MIPVAEGRSPFSPLPPPAPARSWRGALDALVLSAVVVGPVIALHRRGLTDNWVLVGALIGVGAAIAVYVARRVLPWRGLGMVAVVAIALAVFYVASRLFGPQYGVWMGGGLLVAGWAIGVDSLHRWVATGARALGHALAVVLFIPLGLVFVVLPWLVNSVFRLDPLRLPVRGASGWLRRQAPSVRPDQPWSPEAVPARPGAWYRTRAVLAWPALVVIVVLALLAWPEPEPAPPGPPGPTVPTVAGPANAPPVPTAYAGEAWYPEYREDVEYASNVRVANHPVDVNTMGDVRTRTINVVDGVRRTWHPPPCDCRRLKVWMYGGSTTFGLGQRDAHTIASELARVAWEHGVALDVDNRGVLGNAQWQEAERYLWDTATYGPPDLVIFYDGINDVTATQALVEKHIGDVYAPVDFSIRDFWRQYLDETKPATPSDKRGELVLPPTVFTDTPQQFSRLMWKRYQRGRKISDDASALRSVPTAYFWQPTRLTRPQVEGEPEDSDRGYRREREQEAARHIPDGVIDLTGALDEVRVPVFEDDQHHNEVASAVIAEAIYERLAPDIDRIRQGRTVRVPTSTGDG